MFTGNNPTEWAATHTGGTFMLQDYLLAGGKLLVTGQNLNSQWADNQNVGSDNLLAYMSGWITGNQFVPGSTSPCPTVTSDRDFYGSGATAPTATTQLETAFTLLGQTGDVSVNLAGTGAGNQTAPDAGRPIVASDAFDRCVEAHNAAQAAPHARVLGSYTTTKKDGVVVNRLTNAVATGVAPDATLENLEPNLSWAAAYVHVGLEGLNANRGELSAQAALGRLHDFLTDSVSVAVSHKVTADRVASIAQASSTKSTITKYRWDFGDGSPIVETTAPTVTHEYGKGARGTFTVNVEAVDALTRSGVASASVRIIRH
jgi:PKD domain